MNEKKELQVAALENGTVIDHIPSDKVFTVVSLLDLQNTDGNLLIIYALSWLGISLAYQFGSYKVQDEEKQRMKESQKMATTEIEHYCMITES